MPPKIPHLEISKIVILQLEKFGNRNHIPIERYTNMQNAVPKNLTEDFRNDSGYKNRTCYLKNEKPNHN